MIKRTGLLIVVALMTMATVAKSIRVIDKPEVVFNGAAGTLTVTRVELSDTATIVSFHATNKPGWWIRMAKRSVLVDDTGKKYKARYGDGITLSKQFTMPESGEADFRVVFEPLPHKTRFIDFSEGPGGWGIWGIHEAGTKMLKPSKKHLQAEATFRCTDDSRFFRKGNITIKGKFGKKCPAVVEYLGRNPVVQEDHPLVFDVNKDSTFTAVIPAEHPILSYILCKNNTVYFYGEPGDTIHMTFDDEQDVTYAEGTRYAKLLSLMSNHDADIRIPHNEMRKKVEEKPFGEYAKWCEEQCNKLLSKADYFIVRFGLSPEESHLLKTRIRLECAENLCGANLYRNDRYAPDLLDHGSYLPLRRILGEEDLRWLSHEGNTYFLLNRFEFLNPMYMKVLKTSPAVEYEMATDSERMAFDNTVFDKTEPSLLHQLTWTHSRSYNNNYDINPQMADSIAEAHKTLMTYPYLRQRLTEIQTAAKAPKNEAYTLPEGKATDAFNDIVKKYRGKYVYVDFWATTCGPCVAAIKSSKELRDSLSKRDDIEMIFITSERSSPQQAYDKFVEENLKGEEVYRINDDDWRRMMSLFKFLGIPHYEMVTPDGKILSDISNFHLYNPQHFLHSIDDLKK